MHQLLIQVSLVPKYTLELPTKLKLSSKKNFALNLNIYRNAHYFTLNKAKTIFKELLKDSLSNLEPMSKIQVRYKLYLKDNKIKYDISNICSVVDKFFLDALVEYSLIPDDNIRYIPQVIYEFGGYISKEQDPYILAEITELTNET